MNRKMTLLALAGCCPACGANGFVFRVLSGAAEAVPEIAKFRDTHQEVWRHALKLEGCMRSLGKHAAGVVVVCACPQAQLAQLRAETEKAFAPVPVDELDARSYKRLWHLGQQLDRRASRGV